MSATAQDDGGVAIVGMACLFPGAPDLDAYWHNILGKVDATCDPPPEAWDVSSAFDPAFADPDRTYCKRGGWLGALSTFDPLAYGIPPVAVGGEPDQWLALKLAHDALADAGATDLPREVRERAAIILGKGTYVNGGNAIAVQRTLVVGQTIDLIRRLEPERSEAELDALRSELESSLPPLGAETVPGLIPNIIVGRIANRLDLMGPAYTVDAACASSLVAVQHAIRELLSGRCEIALAGGSQVWMPVATLNLFCRLGALSHGERLRAFDQDADGTLLGEGIGIVVLKRTADARAAGDRIYATIRGVGLASDGRGMSVMAPREDGEVLALQRAYAEASVSPATVSLIEAHGTGTPVGDVVEVQALTRVFGERGDGLPRCALGSVKSMISHTIPAAGIAGIIKTALALHHRVLPPTLHVQTPNPKLELERTPFYLNTETRPWIHGDPWPRRAGVNAFGFGGINAHAVLEEVRQDDVRDPAAPAHGTAARARPEHGLAWDSEVCLLQAGSPAQLADRAGELAEAIARRPGMRLADLAWTLNRSCRPEAGTQRLAVVAGSTAELGQRLAQAGSQLAGGECRHIRGASGIYYEAEPLGHAGGLVLVFPGEGAQYPHMLADLCLHFPPAREVFDRIDRLYADHPRGHRLSDWVYPRPAFSEAERSTAEARLMELDMAVESVLSANAAVHAVLRRVLPRVDAMLGHSTGEHSAAMASGALDLETDERLGRFCLGLHASYADAAARHDVPGAVLLALATDADCARALAERAGGELFLAMDNCPHQAVLVGAADPIGRARQLAADEGIIGELLPYDRAVHTPLFAPFAEDLRAVFASLPVQAARVPLWSCTTAAPYPEDPEAIRALLVEHWTRPVRFRETIEALHDAGFRLFVESGPRGNMTAFVQDILRGRPHCAVAGDVRRRSGVTQLCHVVAALAAHGVAVDFDALVADRGVGEIDWRDPESPAASRAPRALHTGWPRMTLSDEAVARWRAARARPGTPDPPPVAAAPDPVGNGRAATSQPPRAPVALNVLPAPAPEAPAAPVAAPAAPVGVLAEDEVEQALRAHLETMARFLDTGEQVMAAYLTGATVQRPAAAPARPAAGGDPVARQAPLLGTVVTHEPARRLVARRVVDPAADRYLLAHTIGRTVSRTDPTLSALALVPLAMSIEMLAEAGAALLPGLTVIGLREVRAHRWLAFDTAPHTFELVAQRVEGEPAQVHVSLHDLDDPAGAAGAAVQGTVLLGPAYPPAPVAAELALPDAQASRWTSDRLYDVMFHGAPWQGVRSVQAVGAGGARAELEVLSRRELLVGDPDPAFCLDPVVLDAAGQLVGFWTAERLACGRVVFPFRLRALELFAPPQPAGTRLHCHAAIRLVGDQLVHSDIEVAGADGHAVMRLSGWEDKRFATPDRFAPLAFPAALGAVSEPWGAPREPHAGAPVSCRRLDGRLSADSELWVRVWSARVLGRRERTLFDALRLTTQGRLQWLAARTAAKDALVELVASELGVALLAADVEILPDPDGRPVVHLPELELGGRRAVVSLTHADGVGAALAALTQDVDGIGLDVEPLRTRPPGFAEAAFTEAERALLAPLAADVQAEWQLRLWCAREAAGKAAGTGLSSGAPAPRVAQLDTDSGVAVVHADGRTYAVHTQREDDVVLATTLAKESL